MTGKEKCQLLRQIRQEIADANGIVYIDAVCTYKGDDCLGTCPKCDQEIAYLDAELNRKVKNGEQITISGISLNTFQASVPAVQSSSDFIKPDGKALGNLLDDIGDMGFSVRTYNCLKRANITTVSDLILKSSSDLMKIRNMSEKSLDEIVKKLTELDLSLKEDFEEEEDPTLSLACGGFGVLKRNNSNTTTRNAEKKSLDEVIKKLEELGLSLAEDPKKEQEDAAPVACGGLDILDPYEDDGEKLCMSIEELDLSVRSHNCLTRAGIATVGDLIDLTLEDLRRINNLGKKNFDEIVTKVHNLGFGFLREFKNSGDLGDQF